MLMQQHSPNYKGKKKFRSPLYYTFYNDGNIFDFNYYESINFHKRLVKTFNKPSCFITDNHGITIYTKDSPSIPDSK